MKKCDNTITLYNAKYDANLDLDVYVRTVITGVSWFRKMTANVVNSGLRTADTVVCRVPVDADFGSKSYVSPKAYEGLTPAETEAFWTLKQGDIIVRGVATEESPIPASLHAKYDEVLTILSVTDDRDGKAPHWKVTGA